MPSTTDHLSGGEVTALSGAAAAQVHAGRQPHQATQGYWETEKNYEAGDQVPSVAFLNGKVLLTWNGNTESVDLPPEAFTAEAEAIFNARTGKLHVKVMQKDPQSPAMLEKQALDPDGPRPRPIDVKVTGRPLQRPPDVVGHGQPTPAQASLYGEAPSLGGPAAALMPQAGLAGTVASDMPTLVHKGGVLEAPSGGETVVRNYDSADTRLTLPESAINKGRVADAGSADLRKAGTPLNPELSRGRAPPGTTIVQGARERRLETEFEQADSSYLQAGRAAIGLPQEQAPEKGTPSTLPRAGAEEAPEAAAGATPPAAAGSDRNVLEAGGAWPAPGERQPTGQQQLPADAQGVAERSRALDLPESGVTEHLPGSVAVEGGDGADMAPEAAGTVSVGDAAQAGGQAVTSSMRDVGRQLPTDQVASHATAGAGEGAEEEEEEGEEYEEGTEEYEEYEDAAEGAFQPFTDRQGVQHVAVDPTKAKVGLTTQPLTAAELYPRADDGSVEPLSSVKRQVAGGDSEVCDVCVCNPCQCDKMVKGQYKASLEMSGPETKRMGKPHLKKVKKPDSSIKPGHHKAGGHMATNDARMHAKPPYVSQDKVNMAARTTAWTGDVPLDPAPGIKISASEVEQEVLHHGSSLRRPDKAAAAVMAAVGAHNDNEAVHGAKDHKSTYTGGRIIANTAEGIHLSTGRHDKKSHVLG